VAYSTLLIHPTPPQQLLELVDVFMPSEEEAKGISGEDTVDAALASLARSVKLVIVTRGSAGASVQCGNVRFDVSSPVPDRVVSTVGAGDAFKAGFLAAMLRGFSLKDSVQYACCAGSAAVQHVGACDVQLTHDDINAKAQEQLLAATPAQA
jgi:sugar/nucleoside kinase (ribokinase family)